MDRLSEIHAPHSLRGIGPSGPGAEILKVLLVEDNPRDARMIREMLAEVKDDGFSLEYAEQLSTALERLAEGGIDMVFLDLSLPDSRGFDTFAQAYARAPQVPIIVLAGL
ncbi:MAG: response regulator, partial [Desulfobacterales bacterium]